MKLVKKLKTAVAMLFGGHFGTLLSHFKISREVMGFFNLYPCKKTCRYIILGGHGMGLQSMCYYLDVIGADAREAFCYEFIEPFYFARRYDGLILDKIPKAKSAKNILASMPVKVPCYQIVRDPIGVIKSCLNASMFHRLESMHTKSDMQDLLLRLLRDIPHLMFYFASMRDLVKNQISEITYWDQDKITTGLETTLKDFSLRFGYKGLDSSGGGGDLFLRAVPFIAAFLVFLNF